MNNLLKAKQTLGEEYTCVLCFENEIITSKDRGVKPLLTLLKTGRDFSSFSAADRVVGRGAAFLYVLLKIKKIHAKVLSESALEVLKANGIFVEFETLTKNIKNRSGNGICPMEQATENTTDPNEALILIEKKLGELK